MGAFAPQLTIMRVCETRDDSRLVRPALYNFHYATANLCAGAASLTVFVTRIIWSTSVLAANRAVFVIALVAYLVAAAVAVPVHRLLARRQEIRPRVAYPRRRDWAWKPGLTEDDAPMYDPCGNWECSKPGCRRLTAGFRRRELWIFIGFIAAMAGIYCVYVQLEDTLPQVMIRRFGLTSGFALLQAINPAILLVLAAVIPFLPIIGQVSVVTRLVVGTLIQALAPLWATFIEAEWAVVLFLVQFSIGEAFAIPMINEYAMKLAPRGEEALYTSMASAPRVIGRAASLILSTGLLQAFCPLAASCTPALVWLIVALIGLTTPLTLLFMRWWKLLT